MTPQELSILAHPLDPAPHGAARDFRSSRDAMLSGLLAPSPAVRLAALERARLDRWLDPYADIVVRAVLFGAAVDDAGRAAFSRHLAGVVRPSTVPLGLVDGMLLLATSASRCDIDLDGLVRAEAERRRITVIAIGSATARPQDDDLLPAATEARVAAEVCASLGDVDAGRTEHIGTWMLLHSVRGSRRLIERASPAANALWRARDPLQRITVEAYLDAGGQVAVACKRLHVHRTTLYYRLDNMPEVVRDALADGVQRSTLHLALKLLRLWDGPAEDEAPVVALG